MIRRPTATPLTLALILLGACATEPREVPIGPRWIVIGVDGGERQVLEKLWRRGDLPHLRDLAERGVFVDLATDYGASPVIWTTIATGVPPDRHGIRDFVVATDSGDVPISSVARRVPALWNMLDRTGRRIAVLGWWATWPAEGISGLVLSDRADLDLPDRIHPESLEDELDRAVARARAGGLPFGGNPASETRDRVVTRFAARAAGEPYDLLLAYYRSVDLASHDSWRAFDPEAFGDPPSTPDADDPVSRAYRAFDSALGEILSAARPDANVLVLSDHGFHATRGEQIQLLLDLDVVLDELHLLRREGPAVDPDSSFAFCFRSPDYRTKKMIRFARAGTEIGSQDLEQRIERLARELSSVRFRGGAQAFRVRSPRRREADRGAHAIVEVLTQQATGALVLADGREIKGAIRHLGSITGSHERRTSGIFLAAGPEIDPGARLEGISIHDVTPTLLAALGLPVAEDFSGRARLDLLTAEAREARNLRRIASWGERASEGSPRASPEDRQLLEELAGLGYLR